MFSIVSCPRCAGQVSITSEASPGAQLHCPLCDSQYPFSELLATLPPALVVMDSPQPSDHLEPLAADDFAGFAPQPAWDAASSSPTGVAVEHGEHSYDAHAHDEHGHAAADDFGFAPVDEHPQPVSMEQHDMAPVEHDLAPAEEHAFAPAAEHGHEPAEHHDFQPAEAHDFAAAEEHGFAPIEEGAFPPAQEAEFNGAEFDGAEFNVDEPLELNPHEEPPHAGSFAPLDETIIQPHSFHEPQDEDFPGHSYHDAGQPQEASFEETSELSFEETDAVAAPADHHGDGEMDFPADEAESPFAEHEGAPSFGQEGEEELEFSTAEAGAFADPDEPPLEMEGFAPQEEGEFGSIEQPHYEEGGELQPGSFTRVPAADTGEDIPVQEFGEGGDEFSLPSPGAPPAAPVATKGKKGVKAAKPGKAARPAKAKSDKPQRSLVGALVAMLAVVIGGITAVATAYWAILFFLGPSRDFLGLAPMMPQAILPASFKKSSGPPMLAGGPGALPSAAPMNQQPPFNPQPLDGGPANPGVPGPGDQPAAGPADEANPPAVNAGLPGGKPAKPVGDLEELPADKPTDPAADLNLLGIPKPKAKPADMPAEDEDPLASPKPKKPADDGFGAPGEAPPSEKMKKPAEPADELAGDDKKPGDAAGAKLPGDELLPGEAPAKPRPGKPEPEMKDDLGLDEPAAKKPAGAPQGEPAEPAPPAAPPVMPVDAPAYSLADFDQAMTDVLASVQTMDEPDTLTPDELKKARAQYFRRFYKLGEVLTFTSDDPAAPRLGDERAATSTLLRKIGQDPDKFAQVGRAAVKWLAYPKRGEHAGILLAGSVAEIEPVGKLYAMNVMVPGVDSPLIVYSGTKPKVAAGDRVILLGSVVDDPKASLPGYDGPDGPVVWNGLSVKLAPEAAE